MEDVPLSTLNLPSNPKPSNPTAKRSRRAAASPQYRIGSRFVTDLYQEGFCGFYYTCRTMAYPGGVVQRRSGCFRLGAWGVLGCEARSLGPGLGSNVNSGLVEG